MNLESLQSRRTWLVGGAALAVLIVAVSYFLVILPKLGTARDTRAESRDNDVANSRLVARHGVLARDAKHLAGLRADLAAALVALPPTSALPEFTHEATQAATTAAVALQTIDVGSVTAVVPVTPVAPAPTAAPSATATPATVSTTSAAAQYQVSITLTTSGPFQNQLDFLKAIENGPRRSLVTSTSFSGAGTKIALTSQLNVFTAPMSVQQVAQLRTLLAAR